MEWFKGWGKRWEWVAAYSLLTLCIVAVAFFGFKGLERKIADDEATKAAQNEGATKVYSVVGTNGQTYIGEIIFITKNRRCRVHEFKHRGQKYLLTEGGSACHLILKPE